MTRTKDLNLEKVSWFNDNGFKNGQWDPGTFLGSNGSDTVSDMVIVQVHKNVNENYDVNRSPTSVASSKAPPESNDIKKIEIFGFRSNSYIGDNAISLLVIGDMLLRSCLPLSGGGIWWYNNFIGGYFSRILTIGKSFTLVNPTYSLPFWPQYDLIDSLIKNCSEMVLGRAEESDDPVNDIIFKLRNILFGQLEKIIGKKIYYVDLKKQEITAIQKNLIETLGYYLSNLKKHFSKNPFDFEVGVVRKSNKTDDRFALLLTPITYTKSTYYEKDIVPEWMKKIGFSPVEVKYSTKVKLSDIRFSLSIFTPKFAHCDFQNSSLSQKDFLGISSYPFCKAKNGGTVDTTNYEYTPLISPDSGLVDGFRSKKVSLAEFYPYKWIAFWERWRNLLKIIREKDGEPFIWVNEHIVRRVKSEEECFYDDPKGSLHIIKGHPTWALAVTNNSLTFLHYEFNNFCYQASITYTADLSPLSLLALANDLRNSFLNSRPQPIDLFAPNGMKLKEEYRDLSDFEDNDYKFPLTWEVGGIGINFAVGMELYNFNGSFSGKICVDNNCTPDLDESFSTEIEDGSYPKIIIKGSFTLFPIVQHENDKDVLYIVPGITGEQDGIGVQFVNFDKDFLKISDSVIEAVRDLLVNLSDYPFQLIVSPPKNVVKNFLVLMMIHPILSEIAGQIYFSLLTAVESGIWLLYLDTYMPEKYNLVEQKVLSFEKGLLKDLLEFIKEGKFSLYDLGKFLAGYKQEFSLLNISYDSTHDVMKIRWRK